MALTKIAVAGGSGTVGRAVVKALVDAKFDVTILSRSSTESEPGTKVQSVDYASLDSLVEALKGQDALVNTLAWGMIPADVHFRLVDAAHKAGVQRFIPSEFGCDTTNPHVATHPVLGGKRTIAQRLREINKQDDRFTWTAVVNGPFLDWGLKNKFFLNFQGKTDIYNGGDIIFSATTLGGVGRAVAGSLAHAEETKNRFVYVAEAETSQNQILEWSGKKDQITLEEVGLQELEAAAYEAVKRSPPDNHTFAVNLIKKAVFGEEYGSHFPKLDNELLGLRKLSEPEMIDLVKQYSG